MQRLGQQRVTGLDFKLPQVARQAISTAVHPAHRPAFFHRPRWLCRIGNQRTDVQVSTGGQHLCCRVSRRRSANDQHIAIRLVGDPRHHRYLRRYGIVGVGASAGIWRRAAVSIKEML